MTAAGVLTTGRLAGGTQAQVEAPALHVGHQAAPQLALAREAARPGPEDSEDSEGSEDSGSNRVDCPEKTWNLMFTSDLPKRRPKSIDSLNDARGCHVCVRFWRVPFWHTAGDDSPADGGACRPTICPGLVGQVPTSDTYHRLWQKAHHEVKQPPRAGSPHI